MGGRGGSGGGASCADRRPGARSASAGRPGRPRPAARSSKWVYYSMSRRCEIVSGGYQFT